MTIHGYKLGFQPSQNISVPVGAKPLSVMTWAINTDRGPTLFLLIDQEEERTRNMHVKIWQEGEDLPDDIHMYSFVSSFEIEWFPTRKQQAHLFIDEHLAKTGLMKQ